MHWIFLSKTVLKRLNGDWWDSGPWWSSLSLSPLTEIWEPWPSPALPGGGLFHPKIFVNLFFAFDCTDGLLAPLYLLSRLGEVFFNMQIFQWNPMEIENAPKKNWLEACDHIFLRNDFPMEPYGEWKYPKVFLTRILRILFFTKRFFNVNPMENGDTQKFFPIKV